MSPSGWRPRILSGTKHAARTLKKTGWPCARLIIKLFDLGALSLTDSGIIILSKQLNGSGDFADRVLKHHGTAVRPPQDLAHTPGKEYVSWHQEQVFKSPVRAL